MEPYIRFGANPIDPYELSPLSDPDQCLDEVPYHLPSSGWSRLAKLKMTEI